MSRISGLLALPFCVALLVSMACNGPGKAADRTKEGHDVSTGPDSASFATVVVDFSASVAPLTQADRLALKETARALGDLTTQDWPPPTTIVWRKIGAASTTLTPLCDTLEYKRSIVGAANTSEALESKLQACVESVVLESRVPGAQEPFTDITGGIMMGVQNWAPMHGKKTLIVFSDFLEDLPKASHPVHLQLRGESVLLLHRPGTTEGDDMLAYLGRIKMWKERLLAAGARSVATLPTFRATLDSVGQAVADHPASGTTIALVNDLVPSSAGQNAVSRAVTTLSAAIAKASGSWASPVNAGWFAARRPAWRTIAVAPVVYTPRIARRQNELNTTDAFRIALEEMGTALQKQNDGGRGDIDGTLRLVTDGETAPSRYLILLSDFLVPPPSLADTPLRGEQVLLVYRAESAPDGAGFFDRLRQWQQYFKSAGASNACALDITTITESAINTCMH